MSGNLVIIWVDGLLQIQYLVIAWIKDNLPTIRHII